MSIALLLRVAGEWCTAHAVGIFFASLLIAVLGTLAAGLGKMGRTDRDGRFIAEAILFLTVAHFLVTVLGVVIAHSLFSVSVFNVHALLLVSPILSVALAIAGLRLVFPLSELAVARLVRDLAYFLVAVAILVWLASRFRGWGVVFVGNLLELVAIVVVGFLLIRRLWRAIGAERKSRALVRTQSDD